MNKPNNRVFIRELPHLALVLAMVGASWWMAGVLPDRVPVHWGLNGQPDGWGSKWVLLLLMPVMILPLYLMLRFLPLIDENVRAKGGPGPGYDSIRFTILLLFAGLHGASLASAAQLPGFHIRYMLSPLFGLLFVVLGVRSRAIPRNGVIGIRTPWTLASEEVWRRTHAAGGRFMVVGGILVAGIGLASEALMLASVLAFAVSLLIWSMLYSRRAARDEASSVRQE